MNQKIAWAVVAFIIVVGAVVYVVMSGKPLGQSVGTTQGTGATNTQPAAMPTPVGGTVSAVSATSITVAGQGGATRTLAITPSTVVRSVVSAGEAGKSAADIAVGTSVFIIPMAGDSNTAGSINMPPPLPPKPGAGAVALSGKVASVSTSGFSLTFADGTTKKVDVNSKTNIYSSVSTGQKGKGLSALTGSQVQVLGTSSGSTVTASTVLVTN